MKLSSCLYDCSIWHLRREPRRNSFGISTFMFLIDLNEINGESSLSKTVDSPLAPLYSLRNEDHIDSSARDLREKLLTFIAAASPDLSSRIVGIKLLTHLRFLNFVFNPISVYYCFDRHEKMIAAVVEVENTFRERKLYLLGGEEGFKQTFEKEFYVSPYSSVDGLFEFALNEPNDSLEVSVNHRERGAVTFEAGMRAKRVELTSKSLATRTLRHPCSSLVAWLGIHLHALILFIKRFPHHEKHEDQYLQKPHYIKTKSS
ncbi:DUF1365 domain-containing protein [Candidatus Obscuribacterales bacterium]|nr:DUF1365 domain-containing protein [Candidatus Obscuribacterales bacterium]